MAVQSMNDNKKKGGLLLNETHSSIKGIRREEEMPTDWTENITVPIYRTGETNCNAKSTGGYHYYAQGIRY